jgi:EmrB/QacA subfamily drug resistance transporter
VTSTVTARSQPAQQPTTPHRWGILIVACLAQLMVVLDATIVNIALPTAQQDLGFSDGSRQWIVTAYALAFGSLLLLGGRLGDLLGRRIMFLTGLVGFAAASALGGAAGSFELLVSARAAQGVFAAMLAPAALSLVTTTFTDAAERARAFGVYGAIAGSGGAIGLLLGGTLTEFLSWRWCLYVNVPIAILALVGGFLWLQRGGGDRTASVDLPGAVLSVSGLVAVVYGLAHAETDGWGSAATLGFIALGVVLLALFVQVERRVRDPLLPLRVLADRNRAASFFAVGISGAGMFAMFLFLTYYLSTILGFSPLSTGLGFLPMSLALMLSAQFATPLVNRIGAKVPVTVGFAAAAVGMLLFTRLEVDSSYARDVLPGLIVVGLGLGFVMSPSMSGATDRVDPEHAGVASAAVNTFQQIGGSIGTAVFSALSASAAESYLSGRDPRDPLTQAQAALESYTAVFWAGVGVYALGAVICGFLLRHGAMAGDRDAPSVPAH